MQAATLWETRRIAHREERRIARWGGWKPQVFTSGGSWAFYKAPELPKGTLCLALDSLVQVLLKGRHPATSMVTGGESSVGCTKAEAHRDCRWKETSAGHLVQLPAQSRASESRLPGALSSFIRLKCKQCHSCSVASLITEMHYLNACSKNRIVAPWS